MAILQASGIQFSDGSILNSFYGIIPQDKKMIFYQAAAPTGWTKITTADAYGGMLPNQSIDGSCIRVTAGGAGGFIDGEAGTPLTTTFAPTPISFNPNGPFTMSGTIGNTTLTTPKIAAHAHGTGSSFAAESGPPAPTSYQSPAVAFYNERINVNVQNSYQQPSQTREPSLYQQPSAYQQPANRRELANRQQNYTERLDQPNPVTSPVQNPRTRQEAVQETVNRRNDNRRQERRRPRTTQVPRETRVQRNQPNPVTRRQERNQRRQSNRQRPRPVNRRRPTSNNRRQNRNHRRRQRRGGRRRRRNRRPQSRRQPRGSNQQNPRTTQSGQQPRRTGQNPQSRRADLQFQRTPRVPGPANRNDPVNRRQNRREVVQQPRTTQAERQATRNRRRATQEPYQQPAQQPVNRRVPRTTQELNTERVVANTNVPAYKQVVANRREIARTPSTIQNPVINSSNYPQPSIVPGGEVRGVNTNAPDGESVGGGQGHNHPFTGSSFDVTAPSGFALQLQYIDVIVCSIN